MHRSAWDNTGGNCAAASYTHRYTYFFGNPRIDMQNVAFYDQTSTDNGPYGWVVRACTVSLPFICKIPTTAFPCNPPPSPAPPPPEPPSPPSPPRRASCKWPGSALLPVQLHLRQAANQLPEYLPCSTRP